MKQALVNFVASLKKHKISYKLVANVHDEIQCEVSEEVAEQVGKFGVLAIEQAGKDFEMRCPLTGEYKVGRNWRETH